MVKVRGKTYQIIPTDLAEKMRDMLLYFKQGKLNRLYEWEVPLLITAKSMSHLDDIKEVVYSQFADR